MSKRKCVVCGQRPAAVPDRETMGRLILRVCRECHAQRLAEDFERIMAQRNKRTEATP